MSMEQIIDVVRGLDGALVVIPGAESDTPEIAWGDAFFYYAPDGGCRSTCSPTRRSSPRTIPTTPRPSSTLQAAGA